MTKKRKRHTPEQIVKKLRDAEAMKSAGKDVPIIPVILAGLLAASI